MARGVTAPVLVVVLLALGSAPASAADYGFSVSPDPPTAGEPATLSVVPDPPAGATVAWDLDADAEFDETGRTVTHTFADRGDVTVRMRVTEAGNKKTTITRTFTVNGAPVVDFGFTPLAPLVGQDVLFTPVVSDPDGDATTLAWSFGDGAVSTDTSPSHPYGATGTYSVLVTAIDAHGASSSAQRDVGVTGASTPPGDSPPSGPPPGESPPGGSLPTGPPAGGGAAPTTTNSTPPVRMRPFPVVRIAGVVLEHGAIVRILSVRAPRGAQVLLRCRGRGCPARSVARAASTARMVRFHRFERRLRAGVVLELFVRKAGRIGKYTRFLIRAGQPPARVDRCLMPGGRRPVRCP